MQIHRQLSDTEFENQFQTCTMDPTIFTHEAHLRLAWIHIHKYGITQAEENIQIQLKNFVKHVGAEHKYNTTLTLAAIKAVYHFMLKSNSDDFDSYIEEFPRLNTNFKDLMACHYGFDIFNSAEAKVRYLQPDLVGFD